jgi:hypothetical protein
MVIKPKTKHGLHAAVMLFTAYEKNLNKSRIFFEDLLPYISFTILNEVTLLWFPPLKVRVLAMLLLLCVRN